MSKSSPLKHKGSHAPYRTEKAYHKAQGGVECSYGEKGAGACLLFT